MHIFHHSPHLQQPDPLGDGIADEIAKERAEPEHFTLDDQIDGQLVAQWERAVAELEKTENNAAGNA